MTWDAALTLAMIAMVFGLLAFTRVAPDLIFLAALTVLLTFEVITPAEAFAGLGNTGLITIAVLYVVAAGLQETGVMSALAGKLLGRPKSIAMAQFRMMAPVTAMSALLNNTPIVMMWLPVLDEWAKKYRISPSKLMLPLSYAAIFGGCCTILGTSTNLVITGLLAEEAPDVRAIGLFEIAWVGLPCALIGIGYVLVASRWLLPDRRGVDQELSNPKEYTVEMLIEPGSPLIGQTIEQAGLRHLRGMFLMEINRGEEVLPAVSPQTRLLVDDRLVFVGIVESVVELQRIRGLTPATNQVFKLDSPRETRVLIEAVVSDTCPLVGQTIRDGRFRTVYNAVIIAVSRNGERIRKKIGDIVLKPGDVLLLETLPSFLDQQRHSRDFYLVSRIEGYTAPRHRRAKIAAGIFLGMIIAAGSGKIDLLYASMIAAGLMIITRCITSNVARSHVRWEVLIAIAASFGMGEAMMKTGLAGEIATTIIGQVGNHPFTALLVIYFLASIITEVLTNNAAAVLMFPIGLSTATSLEVSILPFAIAIMLAASFGFATPLGYQTHMMVYGPGGYRFSDFLRMGVPLNIALGLVAVLLIPLFWPFLPSQ